MKVKRIAGFYFQKTSKRGGAHPTSKPTHASAAHDDYPEEVVECMSDKDRREVHVASSEGHSDETHTADSGEGKRAVVEGTLEEQEDGGQSSETRKDEEDGRLESAKEAADEDNQHTEGEDGEGQRVLPTPAPSSCQPTSNHLDAPVHAEESGTAVRKSCGRGDPTCLSPGLFETSFLPRRLQLATSLLDDFIESFNGPSKQKMKSLTSTPAGPATTVQYQKVPLQRTALRSELRQYEEGPTPTSTLQQKRKKLDSLVRQLPDDLRQQLFPAEVMSSVESINERSDRPAPASAFFGSNNTATHPLDQYGASMDQSSSSVFDSVKGNWEVTDSADEVMLQMDILEHRAQVAMERSDRRRMVRRLQKRWMGEGDSERSNVELELSVKSRGVVGKKKQRPDENTEFESSSEIQNRHRFRSELSKTGLFRMLH
eukprot:CAMPEP_0113885390 /NCGR_PEP_ID=MMETSP0780_2-20120614/10883_1 /TAXON_ID=652834 /ORGANISM="Palpitomonas bilix" /LENGTH=428 /DNA_ID=CAMNT_0000873309 /DNA_START=434 /DNA_END=1723 /DNA_ORIENTATION=- /assembly_acc=CAM_ASM_000599